MIWSTMEETNDKMVKPAVRGNLCKRGGVLFKLPSPSELNISISYLHVILLLIAGKVPSLCPRLLFINLNIEVLMASTLEYDIIC